MGLGPLSAISLAEARSEAARCRKLLLSGVDPIDDRKTRVQAAQNVGSLPFRVAAAEYIENYRTSWKNSKHAQQWENTLDAYAYPVIGDTDVSVIDTPMIVKILKPIWSTKSETASRVRGRIESILDAAKVMGKRTGETPPAGAVIWTRFCPGGTGRRRSSIILRFPGKKSRNSWQRWRNVRLRLPVR
jgi:hypothetical protein